MFVAGLDTRYVDLFPFDRYVVSLEHGLDCFGNLGADTVTYKSAV